MGISTRHFRLLGLGRLLLLLPLAACGGSDAADTADSIPEPEAARAEAQQVSDTVQGRNACRLLDLEVLESIFDESLVARPETHPDWSSCEYFTAAGDMFRMALSVHYEGGREGWENEYAARGGAERLIEAQEGVQVDSIVRPGFVEGLGDAAHFNSLLPSQILIGDTLIQFIMPLMREPGRHFRPLGETVISRLRARR